MKKHHSTHKDVYPISDHYDGKTFFNPNLSIKKSLRDVIKMLKEQRKKETWPLFVRNNEAPGLRASFSHSEVGITYINHASHLIQLDQLNILTDPLYSNRAGPFSLIGPKRVRSPGIALKKLPHINVVLVSHNHYDHMDLAALKELQKRFNPLFIVPLGNQKYLMKKKIHHVIELDWWETHTINEQQAITLVPARHWSMRKWGDRNKALWGGFWIRSADLKIYFSGDSGYGTLFKEIREALGSPHISILPIGSYEPRWFMKEQHMNPEEAVLASLDLGSKLSIATHHQTFRLSHEGYYEPVNELQKQLRLHGVKESEFLAPENGEMIVYEL